MTDRAPDLDRPASDLEGVRYGAIARFEDPRGSFRELWRDDTFGPIDPAQAGAPPGEPARFVQANLSSSAAGVLRGLHLHQRQLDHWVVASGRAFVALVDVRPMLRWSRPASSSPTSGSTSRSASPTGSSRSSPSSSSIS